MTSQPTMPNKRRDNRNRFIYLAQAIDLAQDQGMTEAGRFTVRWASEYLQIPVFDPKPAWALSSLNSGTPGDSGRDALVGANQTLAKAAELLIAVVDLRVPSWGMPFEVLSRAEDPGRPILVVCDRSPNQWPLYLQWALGGNATWLHSGEVCNETSINSALVDQALDILGLWPPNPRES